MIKAALLEYVTQVMDLYDARLAKFNAAIAAGSYLHALQWQTSDVAHVIYWKARAENLKNLALNLNGIELVRGMRQFHASLIQFLIVNANGYNSTSPVANEFHQQEVSATAKVLAKLDEILRYDEEARQLVLEGKV